MKSCASSNLVSFSSSISSEFICKSYLYNKSHHLPFRESSLESRGTLNLIYTDVWEPSPIQSIDGFRYYVMFVDHFTKYIWHYPLHLKSDVFTIFQQFKALSILSYLFILMVVENTLPLKISSVP